MFRQPGGWKKTGGFGRPFKWQARLDPAGMRDLPAAVSVCEAVIRSIERGVLDREMRELIAKLREQMAQLEQGRPIDVELP